jgi:3-oxoacyl-[acyl-carrier-protein] synthase II
MNGRRIVVTGLGIISPLGLTVPETWQNILAGKSGVSHITAFDVSHFPVHISASVKGFDPLKYNISTKDQRKMDAFIQYGLAAASEAIQDAGIEINSNNAKRIGVAMGAGIGGLPLIEKCHQALLEGGPRRISPFFVPGAIINMIAGHISIHYGFKGPSIAVVTACTTGTHNIGHAARIIAYGDADVMITGGSEMATSPLGLGGFAACRALSTQNSNPTRASRPWDKDRDGFVLGDGAGVMVLEEYEHAKKRGANIYAELIGFGASSDAYHMTLPQPEGLGGYDAMVNALQDAKINPEDVNYINAHATSTRSGDEVEALAIQKAFPQRNNLAVSSTKSMTGHLLGAAGAVEAVFSVLAIRDQVAPPTINLDNLEVDYGIDFVPHQAKPMTINVAVSNSFGFGGTNGTLVFKKI